MRPTPAELDGRRHRRETTLITIAFILFLLHPAIEDAADIGLGIANDTYKQAIAVAIVYVPALIALTSRIRNGVRLGIAQFSLLYIFLIVGFGFTVLAHPEYAQLMFEEQWAYRAIPTVFSPLAGIFAFFFIQALDSPNKIIKALQYFAYLNLAYSIVRYAGFRARGYWTGISFTGDSATLTYSLGFGYDTLASVTILLLLTFSARRPLLHLLLALIGIGLISIAGSRGPLVFVLAGLAVYIIHFGIKAARRSAMATVGLITAVSAITIIVLQFSTVVSILAKFLSGLGISSRSIDALVGGDFDDDNGRSIIYEMAQSLIGEGGLFGYGFYGDRFYIHDRFYWGYPHNFFYEILITFGVVGGLIMLALILILVVSAYVRAPADSYRRLILTFFILSLQLLISNSYLYLPWFWALLSLALLTLRHSKRPNSLRSDVVIEATN